MGRNKSRYFRKRRKSPRPKTAAEVKTEQVRSETQEFVPAEYREPTLQTSLLEFFKRM